jgi:hypothetical protein
MEMVYAVVGCGLLFIATCAYLETRDVLLSAARPASLGRAKTAGMFVAGVTIAGGVLACYLIGAVETSL